MGEIIPRFSQNQRKHSPFSQVMQFSKSILLFGPHRAAWDINNLSQQCSLKSFPPLQEAILWLGQGLWAFGNELISKLCGTQLWAVWPHSMGNSSGQAQEAQGIVTKRLGISNWRGEIGVLASDVGSCYLIPDKICHSSLNLRSMWDKLPAFAYIMRSCVMWLETSWKTINFNFDVGPGTGKNIRNPVHLIGHTYVVCRKVVCILTKSSDEVLGPTE